MKKLIILSILIALITSCQDETTVDGFSRTVYRTLKNNDFAGFQSLYLTSGEMETLISTGIIDIPDSDNQVAINYYNPEELHEDQSEMFKDLRKSDEIAWSQTTYESCDVETKKESGVELFRIRIQFLYNGGVNSTRSFKAMRIPANPAAYIKEKFVIIH